MHKTKVSSGIRPFASCDTESMGMKDWAILSDYANLIKQAQTREDAIYLVIKHAISSISSEEHPALFQVEAAKTMMPLIEKQLAGQLSKNAMAIKGLAMESIQEALNNGNVSDLQLLYPVHGFYSTTRGKNRKNGPIMRNNCTNMYMVLEHASMQNMALEISQKFEPTVQVGFNVMRYNDGKHETWQACLVITLP